MPRTSSTHGNLEQTISHVLAQAAGEIVALVRADFAAEVARIIGAPAPAPRASTGGRRAAAAVPAGRPSGRKPHPRRLYSEADVSRVLGLIRSKPGLRSEHIQSEIGDKKVVEKVLAKLRESGQVRTHGTRRAMTYHAA